MSPDGNVFNLKDQDLLSALVDGMPIGEAAEALGFSADEARQRVASMRLMIATHPDNFDRQEARTNPPFDLTPQLVTEGSREPRKSQAGKVAMLDDLVAKFSPEELRDLGKQLLKVADAIDQNWRPETVHSAFSWPSAAARIERNSLELAKVAKLVIEFRQQRAKFLPSETLGEPAWDMLLELFSQFSGGAAVSTKSLTIVSGAPQTTALRHIVMLEREGFVKRRASVTDRRVTLIDLTRKGVVAVGRALEKFPK